MAPNLSQQQIGQRLAKLRKYRGLSQEELAKVIEISRPSLAQLELGRRNLSVVELQKLALVLGFSLDDFLSGSYVVEEEIPIYNKTKTKSKEIRISKPSLQINKFKNILLYILERCAGKPNVNETVLYKLLYFSDFNYYELYEEQLTGATYRKLPYGPVPQQMAAVLKQMIENGNLKRVKTKYKGVTQTRYLPLEKADLREMKATEKDVIDRVIDQYSDWSASAISSYAHKDMPWIASKDGSDINYELVFYRESPFSVRNYGEEMEEI